MINSFQVYRITCFMSHVSIQVPLSCFLRSQSGFGKIICVVKDTSAFEASHILELNSLVTVDAVVLFICNHDV